MIINKINDTPVIIMPKVVPGYKDEARKNIIEAAIAEANERGFENIKMEDIAKRLGISRTTLYIYFKNREEILEAATEQIRNGFGRILGDAFSKDDLEETFGVIYDNFIRNGDKPEMTAVIGVFARAVYDENTAEVLMKNFAGMHDLIQAALEEQKEKGKLSGDINPDITAYAIQTLTLGIHMTAVGGLESETAREVWKLGLRKLLE